MIHSCAILQSVVSLDVGCTCRWLDWLERLGEHPLEFVQRYVGCYWGRKEASLRTSRATAARDPSHCFRFQWTPRRLTKRPRHESIQGGEGYLMPSVFIRLCSFLTLRATTSSRRPQRRSVAVQRMMQAKPSASSVVYGTSIDGASLDTC